MTLAQTATTETLYVDDWVERAGCRILVGWDKPKIRAFVTALATGQQAREDEQFDLLLSTDVNAATGDLLDKWGEAVGEQRLGLSDNEFRPFVLARMLANTCDGTIEALIEVFTAATQPNVDVLYQSVFPAGFCLSVVRPLAMSEAISRRVARMMEDVRPGGRHMCLIEAVPGFYGFEGNPDAHPLDEGLLSRLIQ